MASPIPKSDTHARTNHTVRRSTQAGVGSGSEELVPVAHGDIWGPAALLFRAVYRLNGTYIGLGLYHKTGRWNLNQTCTWI